jgi:hypothetical protein
MNEKPAHFVRLSQPYRKDELTSSNEANATVSKLRALQSFAMPPLSKSTFN